ncbi:MAG: DUF512 domain-containing protein [Clostridiales bacterium]|nr:DUF512 domain-containing protein [Clostridiales bacterium]
MNTQHVIKTVYPDSIAEEMGIEEGDVILRINDNEIKDIFDYQYLIQDEYIEVLVRKKGGEEWLLEIDKEYDEELGVEFENGLMDEYRSCRNKCIFCFIDQMPKGMRDTLYFKDDDSRLSFLQGNYVTLTNMVDSDIERIIKYHLSPINISFHTTNPELRCKMLNNRFAGDSLRHVKRLYEAGITMNGQIVLCKGINDGGELERSIADLYEYMPQLESVSVVPVGLTDYREGLFKLEPFTKEDAVCVLECIHRWQEKIYKEHGTHFVHASDEWYIMAGEELPEESRYDGYLQLENGVGMLRLMMNEFDEAMEEFAEGVRTQYEGRELPMAIEKHDIVTDTEEVRAGEELSIATGQLAYPYIKKMADTIMQHFPQLDIHVYAIINNFFGRLITVSGLLTGQDIINQLKDKKLGARLLLPQNVLRSGEDYFLDDITVSEMEKALQVKVDIVKSSGHDFVESILRYKKLK